MQEINDEHDKKREWLSDSIKVAVLIWSAGLLTASYVRLPSGQKIMDFDPTFIASVFSGSLAGFGVALTRNATGNANNNANSGGNANDFSNVGVYSRPKDEEEEKTEPAVAPLWEEPAVEPSLEERVSNLESKVEPSEGDETGEGYVQPRRGDL